MDSWISFWLSELSEPLSSPIYLALFMVFFFLSVLGTYAFRGIPNWIIDSRESQLLRLFAANIAVVSLTGGVILVLQSMSVPVVSRRLWIGLVVLILALHVIGLVGVGRFMAHRARSDGRQDTLDADLLH